MHGHKVKPTNQSPLTSIPTSIDSESLKRLIDIVGTASTCSGHPHEKFIQMAVSQKGKFSSVSGEVVAFLDDHLPVTINDL